MELIISYKEHSSPMTRAMKIIDIVRVGNQSNYCIGLDFYPNINRPNLVIGTEDNDYPLKFKG